MTERYETRETLGDTRYATTYKAWDRERKRPCVVKRFSLAEGAHVRTRELVALDGPEIAKAKELFRREARVLAEIDGTPGIPRFYDSFTRHSKHDVELFIVQEHIEGQDLQRRVAAGKRFTESEARQLALRVARILQRLHNREPPLIHRDIKPSNIISTPNGDVFLVDFGAVKERLARKDIGDATIVGTFGYMPIEQFEGNTCPASDIFSLGATLLFCLTGREPAELRGVARTLEVPGDVAVSPGFRRLHGRMLASRLDERFGSAEELIAALEGPAEGRPPSRRPKALYAATAALALAVGYLVVAPRREPGAPPAPAEQISPPSALRGRPISRDGPASSRPPALPGALVPLDGTAWQQLPGLEGLVLSWEEDPEGDVWATTTEAVLEFPGGDPTRPVERFRWPRLRASALIGANEVVFGTQRGEVLLFRDGSIETLSGAVPVEKPSITCVAARGASVWAGTAEGLYAWEGDSWRLELRPAGEIRDILVTGDGDRVFAATPEALWEWRQQAWLQLWNPAQRLEVWTLTETRDGAILIGLDHGFATVGTGPLVAELHRRPEQIMSISQAPGRQTWFGSWIAGVAVQDAAGSELEYDATLRVLPHQQVRAVLADSHGQVWCALGNPIKNLVGTATELIQAIRAPPPAPVESGSLHQLRLRLTWLGRPIEEFTRAVPKITLSPKDRRLRSRDYQTRYAGSELTIPAIRKGAYGLGLSLAAGERGMQPGDFWQTQDVDVPHAGPVEVKLLRVVRLLEPHDSKHVIPVRSRAWDTVPVLDAPVRFAWEPLAADRIEYSVSIGKVLLDEHLYLGGAVATERTHGHRIELDLPANEGGVLYSFHLAALHEGEWVGRTYFHSEGSSDWNYDFRVRPR